MLSARRQGAVVFTLGFVAADVATEIHPSEEPSKAKQPHPTWQLKVFFPAGAENFH